MGTVEHVMSNSRQKTLRLRLKTGELLIRKAVQEYLVGREYFVLVNIEGTPEAYAVENILAVTVLSNGEFVPIALQRRGKK